MDQIKDAFNKVKQDIDFLYDELQEIKRTLNDIKLMQTDRQTNPTHPHIIPTHKQTPTHNYAPQAQKSPNSLISIGNQGVPTDRQTNQQTDRQTENTSKNDKISHLRRVSEIVESLDSLKQEVRIKFKKLTTKEMLIFTTIYQLEEQGMQVDYSLISEKLMLSESSIRDYVGKITAKGIPLNKAKQGNKKVFLSIPEDLKRIATLNTINHLREL
jgi:hypothetical protein